MKNLYFKSIVFIGILYSNLASAQIAGTYEVLKNNCDNFIFAQSKEAVVIANDAVFKVGIITNQTQDLSPKLIAAFDFKVGVKEQACLVDSCESIFVGAYSANNTQFTHFFLQREDLSSEAILKNKVTFTLKDNLLEINNNSKICLLKKL